MFLCVKQKPHKLFGDNFRQISIFASAFLPEGLQATHPTDPAEPWSPR